MLVRINNPHTQYYVTNIALIKVTSPASTRNIMDEIVEEFKKKMQKGKKTEYCAKVIRRSGNQGVGYQEVRESGKG